MKITNCLNGSIAVYLVLNSTWVTLSRVYSLFSTEIMVYRYLKMILVTLNVP